MIFKNSVKTFCSECLKENQDAQEKRGHLVGYPISEVSYLCTIFFNGCGHKRVAILNPEQIEKITEVKDESQSQKEST